MRTALADRHLPRFQAIPADSIPPVVAHLRASRAFRGEHLAALDSISSGDDLFRVAQSAGLDHGGVVLTIVHDGTPAINAALEALVGRPIRPWSATAEAQRAAAPKPQARGVAVVRERASDGKWVVAVVANPKKPGSSTHIRFAQWVVGRTVTECMAAGLTRADVDWDVSRGFVTLGDTRPE